jgi:hypothetical protein
MVTTEERKKGKRKQVDENDDGKTMKGARGPGVR